MSDAAPEHDVTGVVPALDVVVYTVEHVGAVVRSLLDSLFTNPEYVGVTVGTASPWVTECDDAVTVNAFFAMVTEPGT